MSLQVETIPFTLRTGAGSQTISHVRYPSMTAQAIIFTCADNSGTNSEIYSFGFDDGTTHIGAGVGVSEAFGVEVSARGYSAVYSLVVTQAQVFFGGYERRLSGYVSALNVGSFEITLDLNNTPGAEWFAILIGGTNVSCAVGLYDVTPGSGTVNVGFDPVALLKLGTVDAGSDGNVAGADNSYGFATLCGPDQQVGWGGAMGPGSSQSASFLIDAVVQEDIAFTSTTISDPVSVAFVANGFTVTVSGTPNWNIGYLAIGGSAVSANLVQIIPPTSTGTQNIALTATDPVVAFFGSVCKPHTVGAGNVDINFHFGVYDGVSNMSQWWGVQDVHGTSNPYARDRLSSTTKCINLATALGASTSVVDAAASCTLTATNLALNWTTASSPAREVWALVLAHNLTGTTNACGANPQASITVIKNATPIPGGQTQFPFATTGGLSPSTFTLMDGESQLFSGLSAGTYGVTEQAPTGWAASYSVSDGSPHDAIVLGTGEAVTVTVTNTFQSSTSQMRVYRRFRLPWDGNKRIFIPRIEIVAQMGVGNADDTDPVMSMRISPDGGVNWGPFRDMPLGASSEPQIRAYLTRFCQGMRNPVAELICDAPVFVGWIACELPQDFTVGTS